MCPCNQGISDGTATAPTTSAQSDGAKLAKQIVPIGTGVAVGVGVGNHMKKTRRTSTVVAAVSGVGAGLVASYVTGKVMDKVI